MGKGEKVGTDTSVETLRSFEQADLAPRDELVHLELRVELLANLGSQRPYVRTVLLEDLRLGFPECHGRLLLLLGAIPQALESLVETGIVLELLEDFLGQLLRLRAHLVAEDVSHQLLGRLFTALQLA